MSGGLSISLNYIIYLNAVLVVCTERWHLLTYKKEKKRKMEKHRGMKSWESEKMGTETEIISFTAHFRYIRFAVVKDMRSIECPAIYHRFSSYSSTD